MRFLLYNIRYGTGSGKGFHRPFPLAGHLRRHGVNMSAIAAFIRQVQPDIAGLVEVDTGSVLARRQNQAERLAAELGHYHSHGVKYAARSWPTRLPVLRRQSNAFLTRDAIRHEKFHYFSHGVKRLVIELELDRLVVFLVHLSLKYRHRAHQIQDLYDLVKATDKPTIVAGDFNLFWGDREIRLFLAASGLRNASPAGACTHPSHAPRRQLDFILHSPAIRITGFQTPPVTYSDHLPLLCDFELPQ